MAFKYHNDNNPLEPHNCIMFLLLSLVGLVMLVTESGSWMPVKKPAVIKPDSKKPGPSNDLNGLQK